MKVINSWLLNCDSMMKEFKQKDGWLEGCTMVAQNMSAFRADYHTDQFSCNFMTKFALVMTILAY